MTDAGGRHDGARPRPERAAHPDAPPPASWPPVLCYHRVGGPLELGVTRVGRSVFARQMRALAAAGWRTLRLAEYGVDRRPQPGAFLLTFDDGYASLTDDVFPLLGDLGFTATTFLITDYVGRRNTWDARYTWRRVRHLDWAAIAHWSARGFDFASHGATHRRLTWLDDAAARSELERSRDTLQVRLGKDPAAVAYPFGAADARIRRLARQAGYRLGFGGVRAAGDDPLGVPRVPVYAWDVGRTPLGLRRDAVGRAGRMVAHVANRCAVGTSVLLALGSGGRRGRGRG